MKTNYHKEKGETLPPYHVFKVLGEYFVFDTSTRLLYNINLLAFEFLKECLKRSIEDAAQEIILRNKFSNEEVSLMKSEISLLGENGLFDIPDYSNTQEEIEKSLNSIYKDSSISSITLGLTETCNLACVYCYCGKIRDHSTKRMTKSVAKKAIDWLFQNSGDVEILSITFLGGEPMLNKEVIYYSVNYSQKLARKSSKKMRFNMTTNATLIDEKDAAFFKENNFSILVSIDGPPAIHDKQCPTRDGKGSFLQTAEGARNVFNAQKTTMARCSMVSPAPKISDLLAFFEAFGFDNCFLGPVINAEADVTELDFSDDDYLTFNLQSEALIPQILERMKNKQNAFYDPYWQLVSSYERPNQQIFPSNCGAAKSGCLYINVDGSVYPCHHHFSYETWKLGSILDEAPLNVDAMKNYWREYRRVRKKCESCWAAMICMGPCSAELIREDGTFSSNIRFCDSRKFVLERAGYIFTKKNLFDTQNTSNETGEQ